MQIYQPIIAGSLVVSGSITTTSDLIVSGSTTFSGSVYINNQQITPGGSGASKGFAIAMAAAL